MRCLSTALAVVALALCGGSSPGAMTAKPAAVPAVLPRAILWHGWVTILLDGKTLPGFAAWYGSPDVVPVHRFSGTRLYVGSGLAWRDLTEAEQVRSTVIIERIEMGVSQGPFDPRAR